MKQYTVEIEITERKTMTIEVEDWQDPVTKAIEIHKKYPEFGNKEVTFKGRISSDITKKTDV